MGGGGEAGTSLRPPGWGVRLLFYKEPLGGGSGQQATCSGPSLGPDTLSHSHQVQMLPAPALEDGGQSSRRSLPISRPGTLPAPNLRLPASWRVF